MSVRCFETLNKLNRCADDYCAPLYNEGQMEQLEQPKITQLVKAILEEHKNERPVSSSDLDFDDLTDTATITTNALVEALQYSVDIYQINDEQIELILNIATSIALRLVKGDDRLFSSIEGETTTTSSNIDESSFLSQKTTNNK